MGRKLPDTMARYAAAACRVASSWVYSPIMPSGQSMHRRVNAPASALPSSRLTRRLCRTAAGFSCPRYWAIIMPATEPMPATATDTMLANFPARPTPATLTLPNWPIMI